MATSREVAEAYIEVHGDLSPFRRGLDKAGDEARAAGENMADDFGDGWNKRIKSEVLDRWETMLDAMYSDNKLDWNELIGKFDSTDLDRADVQIHDFMRRMQEAGKLNAEQYDEVSQRVRQVIKDKQNEYFVQQDLNNLTRDQTEAIRENMNFDRMRAASAAATLQVEQERARVVDAANVTERDRAEIIEGVSRATRKVKKDTDEAGDSTSLLGTLTDKLKLSWARMDSTVRLAIGAIISAAGPLATLGSGLAGSLVAVASSAAQAVGALGAMVGPAVAFGVGIALAINSFDEILARVPRIQTSLDRIANAWTAQADRFGRQWEGALDSLLASFATKLEAFDFGTPLGQAFAEITAGFDRVVNGPSFNAFMTEMTTNFPAAVSGMGRGLASLTDGFFALFAGAGPVAAQLGEDFARWGQRISEALEKARASGEIEALFWRMRDSLLAVLDLAGSLGMALGTLFDLGAASGNRMITSLAGIVDQFNAWMQTEQGRATMLTWFNNAERIIRSMEPLAVGLGKALALLVTERSITLFEQLMGTMGELLPILAEILSVISDLGILNILAQLLLAVGKAVQPLLPPLAQLATVLGDMLMQAITVLTPLLVAVGEALAPIAQAAADLWAQIAPTLIPALTQLVEVLTPLIVMVIDLAAAIITNLIPVIGPLFVTYITTTVDAFTLLIQIITQVVSFITTVATELINFFLNLGTNISNFNATVNQMLADFWTGIATQFQTFIAGFQAGWDSFWTGLGTGLAAIWAGITQFFTDAWLNITTGWTNFTTMLGESWNAFWNGLGAIIQTVWATILTLLQTAWQNIVSGVDAMFIQPWNQFWTAFWNALPENVRQSWTDIWNTVTNFVGQVISNIQNFISQVTSAWNSFWTEVGNRANQAWQQIQQWVQNGVQQVQNFIQNFATQVQNQWNQFWQQVGQVLQQAWDRIVQSVQAGINNLTSNISNLVNSVTSQWNSFWSQVGSSTSNAWNQISSFVSNGINRVTSFVSNGVNQVISFFSNAWNTVVSNAAAMMANLSNSVANGINQVANWFAQLPGRAGAALGGMVGQLFNVGVQMIQGLINGVQAMAANVVNAARNVVGGAINAAKSLLGIASPSKVFTQFGIFTGQGLAKGMSRSENEVVSASEHMADMALEAFDRTKARLAGLETARGLAEGLESSKARVQAALGKLDPSATASFSASVAGTAAKIGTPIAAANAQAGQSVRETVIENLNFVTRATEPRVLVGMLTDELTSITSKGNI